MRMLDFAATQAWALLPEKASELAAIAEREHEISPQALEAYRSFQLERSERGRERDGVAILDVQGPLFKKANLFVRISGATSYEILRHDLQAALDNPEIKSILLVVDSPGGEANGCDELATAIYEARSIKPITAYVSGMAASGGYWIAAAASRVVVSDAALLGSIGVVLGIPDKRAAEERRGIRTIEFVSSQSPGKRPDVGTDEGRSRIQGMVDDLAEVFVAAVAKYRGVSVETVIKNFGAGGVKIGAKAVAAGMADSVGQIEATISGMRRAPTASARRGAMVQAPVAASLPAIASLGAPASQEDVSARLKTILTSTTASALPTVADMLAFQLNLSGEASLAVMAVAKLEFDRLASAPIGAQHTSEERRHAWLVRNIQAGALGLENWTLAPRATGQ